MLYINEEQRAIAQVETIDELQERLNIEKDKNEKLTVRLTDQARQLHQQGMTTFMPMSEARTRTPSQGRFPERDSRSRPPVPPIRMSTEASALQFMADGRERAIGTRPLPIRTAYQTAPAVSVSGTGGRGQVDRNVLNAGTLRRLSANISDEGCEFRK